MRTVLNHDLTRILVLAALYAVTGKLGLFLAVPPGFATVIWPPSGIALGMLIMHGRRLWPGILLGSFLLNAQIAGAFDHGLDLAKLPLAFGIATGSTVQALAGWFLVRRFVGLPLRFNRFRDVARLFLLCGPLACVVAASVGVSCLHLASLMPTDKLAPNWLAWWAGDLFGIVVFLPLVLMAPGGRNPIEWRGAVIGRAPVLALLLVLIPLGLTFYAWKIASQTAYDQSRAQFQALASESEKALLHRLGSYDSALIGAAAYWQETPDMSHDSWRRYVEALGIERNYPGIKGIGWVQPVPDDQLQPHAEAVRKDGFPSYQIHPVNNGPHYIITYLEPQKGNATAMGLDLAFEVHRREAAERARDTGRPAMTRRIILVQDQSKRAGFLLFHPLYRPGQATDTVEDRRQAFAGWIYSPFVAENLLTDLTASQGTTLNLRVYDEGREDPANLIYASDAAPKTATVPAVFSERRTLSVGQSRWLVVWDSTPQFEAAGRYYNPMFILVGGLLFTGMFAIFVFVSSLRNGETLQLLAGRHRFVLPAVVLAFMSVGSGVLYKTLADQEVKFVHTLVDKDGARVGQLIDSQAQAELAALERMAGRWRLEDGTPEPLWRLDAAAHVSQMAGLEAVQWVDRDLKVRWSESAATGPAWTAADHHRQLTALDAAGGSDKTIIAPLVQHDGLARFIAYVPLQRHGLFDGYLAVTFSVADFIKAGLPGDLREAYAAELTDGKTAYLLSTPQAPEAAAWKVAKPLVVANQAWSLNLTPTLAYVQSQTSILPTLALIAGLIISALTALSVQALVVLRQRSRDLESSNRQAIDLANRTSTILNTVLDGVITIDQRGLVEGVNPAAQRIFGYAEDELIGRNISVLMPEPYRSGHDGYLHAYDKTHETHVIGDKREVQGLRRDGTVFAMELTVNEMELQGRRLYVGTVKDISERKHAEDQKRAQRIQIESIARMLEDSVNEIFIVDLETLNFLQVNRGGRDNLGYSLDELRTMTPLDIKPHMNLGGFRNLIARLLDGSTDKVVFDTPHRRKDGSHYDAEVHIQTGTYDGRPVLFQIILDVTDRRAQEEALRTSEDTFRSAMENASIGMALVDPSGRWLRVNRAMTDLLGYSSEELLSNDFQSITHPDDLEADLAFVGRVLSGELRSYALEKRYFRKDGRIIWTLLNASLVRDSVGQPHYFISQVLDITERKEMERLKSEFVSVVSHELRTPLTSIRGSLGLLGALGEALPDKAVRLVELARKNCERLIPLINDILDIDKIAAGKMRFDLRDERLAELVARSVDANQPFAQKHGVIFAVEPVDPGLVIHVDAARFEQALTNLLSNAAKFSPPGETVTVSVEDAAGRVRIRVRDHGPGIPEDFRERIFGRFSQADSSRTRAKTGTGLGLHITKQIVEHMGGHIDFDSEPGAGAVFWLDFPVVVTAVSGVAALAPLATMPRTTLPQILHIEDDADFSHFLSVALAGRAEVTTAHTLQQGRALAGQGRFDLIVIDQVLPDGDGLDVLDGAGEVPAIILASDEVAVAGHRHIRATLVKSRHSEDRIIATILEQLHAAG